MTLILPSIAALYFAYLLYEKRRAVKDRAVLQHVIHVNGTRGKSSTCRLIDAGLRAGGMRVFCKTTGTDPMTIDTTGRQNVIDRRGKANIKEQLAILHEAALQKADVLVIECMAISPELQRVSQRDILQADIGVITNVRRDHMDVMGSSLDQVCDSLSGTIPQNGVLFTAEKNHFERLSRKAAQLGSKAVLSCPQGDEDAIDFAENVALAAAVCGHLQVDRATALRGMRRFQRDPYALSLHTFHRALFINGLSINDIDSTAAVWQTVRSRNHLEDKELILLVNNRADRGSRTEDMLRLCMLLRPAQVWLMGAARRFMERSIQRQCKTTRVLYLHSAKEIPAETLRASQVIFAVGNIAGSGRALMERVRKEGTPFVS